MRRETEWTKQDGSKDFLNAKAPLQNTFQKAVEAAKCRNRWSSKSAEKGNQINSIQQSTRIKRG